MSRADAIDTGLHWVDAPCPRCGVVETLAITISSVLTTPQDDVPKLAGKAKGSALDHQCGQLTLPADDQLPVPDGDDV